MTLERHPRYRDLWGYVQYTRPLETRADLDLWAPTFLAGQFGELTLLGFAGPGGSQDTSMVMQQIRAFIVHDDEQRDCFRSAFEQARSIVQSRQGAVQAVASVLLRELTLQATQAFSVIESE